MLQRKDLHALDPPAPHDRRPPFGLARRVMALIAVFVVLADILVLVPSIANFRDTWLHDRLAAAQTAALVFEAAPAGMVPAELQSAILASVGARTIVLKMHDTRRLLAVADMPAVIDEQYDVRNASLWQQIAAAFGTLTAPRGRILNVVGDAPLGGESLEIVIPEAPLKEALTRFALRLVLLSVLISGAITALVMIAIHAMVLRPMRRLTHSIMDFGAAPEDATRIIEPSGKQHEVGQAEAALAGMQRALARELSEKKNLAALGLAVAKINHDLRNMLAAAQLMSDRLAGTTDPMAQRIVPKLIATLDRAIGFCQATLAYGRAVEPPPAPRSTALRPLVEEIRDMVVPAGSNLRFVIDMPGECHVHADPDQLFRVLANLLRNAVEALGSAGPASADEAPVIAVEARREGHGVRIDIIDNGPGIPQALRASLFQAFHASSRNGGSGLGLAIAADLMRAQGGSLVLQEGADGAHFVLRLPAHPNGNGRR